MNDHQSVPQTQDESTEQSFVDSDYTYNVSGADFGGISSVVTSHQDVDQFLYASSSSQDAASLGSMNQEGVFSGASDQSHNIYSPAQSIRTDSRPNDIDSAEFLFLELLVASDDTSNVASFTGSSNTNTVL
ncbi:hypothetical protein FLONG3_1887 [Fusarium longipes]|uniref:Uncharacterized protein n=1 Tax=Fusarium longipes TaxID=694270 RepID=A0A395T5B5_9HYPO|nr:hypothetical protein FLONG3_1887 [Fusarium longipes]